MDYERLDSDFPVGIYRATRAGTVLDANPVAVSVIGADEQATILDQELSTFCANESAWTSFLDRLHTDGQVTDYEFTLRTLEGREKQVSTTAHLSETENGAVIEGTLVPENEDRRHERDHHLDQLLEGSDDALWLFDSEWEELLFVNSSYEEIFGQDIEEIEDDPQAFVEGIHPDDREMVREKMAMLSDGNPTELEYRVNPRKDFERWAWVKGKPIYENGEVVRIAGFTRDVTRRKRTQKRLQLLNRTAVELAQADSPDAALETSVGLVQSLFETPYSAVWEKNTSGESLEIVVASEASTALIETESRLEMESLAHGSESPLWDVFETSGVTVFDDPSEMLVADIQLGSVIAVPLGRDRILTVSADAEDAFNEIDTHLVTVFAQHLSGILKSLDRKVTLEEVTDDLKRSNDRLQQFAYVASHDLQEPLRMISSYVDLLEMEYGNELDEEAEQYIEFAVDGANRMRSMVNDLLQFSRIESNAQPLEQVDSEVVLADVQQDLELTIEETDAEITSDPLPLVHADRNQLQHVFQNLITNAINYSGDGDPRIHVSAEHVTDKIHFSIEDDGIGIPEDQQDRIFEVFTRGERNDSDSGTGIGLAICEQIISRHDGDIWVDSTANDGATFYCTFPAKEESHE